jgi:putative transposase
MSPTRRRPYSTDLNDAEWALVEPLLPQRRPGDGRGAPRKHDRREILNAIFYQARTGCPWDDLPRDFPPKSTVYDYFQAWTRDGTLQRLHDTLRGAVRQQVGRDPQPRAGSVDSQTVKSTEKGGAPARLGSTEARP